MTTINDTPAERRLTWGVVAFECLHAGHIEWAADAFEYAIAKEPPRGWPEDHDATRPDLAPVPGWPAKLLGRTLIQVIKLRARFGTNNTQNRSQA